MNNNELLNIVNDALNDAELKSAEIPNIDLYVDQIINLIAEKQKEGSERYRERQLTKTMINNYSKDGLITPVKGKKYNKEQILQMLTVYTLKGTLSIGEIKRLLEGAYAVDGFDGESLKDFYDRYIDIKKFNRSYVQNTVYEIIEQNRFDVDNDIDYISTVCVLVSLSAQLRNIAQAMIDEKFPEPEEPEEDEEKDIEKSERKEEKKAEKAERKEEKKAEKAERKEDKESEKAEKKQKKEEKKAKEE